jgi:hypothetical protein
MLRRLAVALGLAAAWIPSSNVAPSSPQVVLVVGQGPVRPGDGWGTWRDINQSARSGAHE